MAFGFGFDFGFGFGFSFSFSFDSGFGSGSGSLIKYFQQQQKFVQNLAFLMLEAALFPRKVSLLLLIRCRFQSQFYITAKKWGPHCLTNSRFSTRGKIVSKQKTRARPETDKILALRRKICEFNYGTQHVCTYNF